MVLCGLDRLLDQGLPLLKGRRIGLVTNHTGVDRQLRSNVDLLHRHPDYHLAALFGPEHGVRGNAAAGERVKSCIDARTGLPVHSLFGDTQRPRAEMLEHLDAMLFDIMDCGSRYYTYPYTMAYTMQAAAEKGIPYVVLDRPNPINGLRVEGNVLQPGFESFAGLYPIAMRHGLTIGELAGMFNVEFGIGCDLHVVPMLGWQREMWWEQTGNPWVMPSPNAPTPEFAVIYPGTCLFEGTNLSEGRGTTKPFQVIGAPWVEAQDWADQLNGLGLAGVLFRPTWFTPTFARHQDQLCGGVEIHVLDRATFEPVRAALEMIATVRRLHPGQFAWRGLVGDGPCVFDRLAGTDRLRHDLDNGLSPAEIIRGWREELDAFKEVRRKHLLY
jgi:uncharacterized protein YbbC (DUF1343 family)